MSVLEPGAARAFAAEWIAAWNAHDLDRVLRHYADDVEFSSPYVVAITGVASGTVRGKEALRAYWAKALTLVPDLHFELIGVYAGVDVLTVHYRGHRGQVTETFHLDVSGTVDRAAATYEVAVDVTA